MRDLFEKSRLFPILLGPLKGTYIYIAPRHGIKKILGIYEPKVAQIITKEVHPNDVCMDIGAHIGYFSLLMARLIGKDGKVVAVEPIQSNIEYLHHSMNKNHLQNIVLCPIAVGDKKKKAQADVFIDSDMANLVDSPFKPTAHAHAKQELQITTLDKLIDTIKFKKIDFIKIDVEGYEEYVLKGSHDVLQKNKPTLLIEIHSSSIGHTVYAWLKELNYSILDLDYNQITDHFFDTIESTHNQLHILCKYDRPIT